MSSSLLKDKAIEFLETALLEQPSKVGALCIYCIKNKRTGIYIKTLSEIPEEEEVLIMPYSAFKVTGINRITDTAEKSKLKRIEIELEELDESLYPAFSADDLDAADREFLKEGVITVLRNNEL